MAIKGTLCDNPYIATGENCKEHKFCAGAVCHWFNTDFFEEKTFSYAYSTCPKCGLSNSDNTDKCPKCKEWMTATWLPTGYLNAL